MKIGKAKELLKFCVENNLACLLVGSPGIGKTSIVEQTAEELGQDFMSMHPVVSDPTDFKGMPFPKGDVAEFLPFGDLNRLIHAEKPTICLIDDIGQAPASVQAACMQLLLARRINGHKIADHVTFIAATNRRQDRAGVTGILEPVKSRFATIAHVDTDIEEWTQWALGQKTPIELVAFLRWRVELLNKFEPSKDMKNSPNPRSWGWVGSFLKKKLPENLWNDAFAGAVGEGAAAEFLAFIKIFRSLPTKESIINNPTKAPIPDVTKKNGVSTMYATCGMLANACTEENIDRVVQYASRGRFPEEFKTLLITDAIRINPELQNTFTFIGEAVNQRL